MTNKWVGIAKKLAALLMIELFVPGGTLVVLTILFSGRARQFLRISHRA